MYRLIFITILLFALFLRTVSLSNIPPGVNRDEAAIGYTAYSLLITGKDEYGQSYPLSFKSFGDWKVPFYFYAAIPFVKILGLSEFSTRLPSAIFGTLTVLLCFYLVMEILEIDDQSDKSRRQSKMTALISSFLLAISPWHIFMSRTASESNVAVFLVTGGLLFFFKSFKINYLITASFFLLALSLFTYHGNHVFTPLLMLILCVIYVKKNGLSRWLLISCGLFLILAGVIFTKTLFEADKTKISGLFILNDPAKVHEFIELRRKIYTNGDFFATMIHNRPMLLVRTTINNYLKSFSPEFLFIQGGANFQHNIPNFGNLYIWEAFTLPISLYFLLRSSNRYKWFLLLWFLISPLPASITRDAPHTSRMMVLLPLPAILSAYGIVQIGLHIKNNLPRMTFAGIMFLVILLNFIIFVDQYFFYFPYIAADKWGYPYKHLVEKVTPLMPFYNEIIISKPDLSPYIYFLFYNQIDPQKYQTRAVRYQETKEGFQHVKSFTNLSFKNIGWSGELALPNRLYVDWVDSLPSGATNSAILITKNTLIKMEKDGINTSGLIPGMLIKSRIAETISLPDGSPFIYLISTYLETSAPEYVP